MSFEKIFSQNHIYKKIISNLDSITDIENLTSSSPSLYYDVDNVSIKKTVYYDSNYCYFKYVPSNSNSQEDKIMFKNSSDGTTFDIASLNEYITNSNTVSEFTDTIIISFTDYIPLTLENSELFFNKIALFIDTLFNLFPNLFKLIIHSVVTVFYSIIKDLSTSKIKVLTFDQIYNNDIEINCPVNTNPITMLSNLRQLQISFNKILPYLESKVKLIYDTIIREISYNEKLKLMISGYMGKNLSLGQKDVMKLINKYNIDIGLLGVPFPNDIFGLTNIMKNNLKMNNIVELNLTLNSLSICQNFVNSLPKMERIRILKLNFSNRWFSEYKMLKEKMEPREDLMLLPSFNKNIEKIYINLEYYYTDYDNSDQAYLSEKNDVGQELIKRFGNNIKTLHLGGIPNMTNEMGELLSKNCSNLQELYLIPTQSIDISFILNMKNLKFVSLKRMHKLIIPDHVQMVIVNFVNDMTYRKLRMLSDDECYNYFKNHFCRSFKISIRNFVDRSLQYCMLFDNVLQWKKYQVKLRLYKEYLHDSTSF